MFLQDNCYEVLSSRVDRRIISVDPFKSIRAPGQVCRLGNLYFEIFTVIITFSRGSTKNYTSVPTVDDEILLLSSSQHSLFYKYVGPSSANDFYSNQKFD